MSFQYISFTGPQSLRTLLKKAFFLETKQLTIIVVETEKCILEENKRIIWQCTKTKKRKEKNTE